MNKRIGMRLLAIVMIAAMCASPAFAAKAAKSAKKGRAVKNEIKSGAILMDMTSGTVLRARNVDEKIPPASIAKIMSMYVALDKIAAGKVGLNDIVRISDRAGKSNGSLMHIKAGEDVWFEDLLMGMSVSSGNDASIAVAEHVAGSVEAFAAMMNAKAKELGMKNTKFYNPNGLPAAGQVTTVRDMLLLSRSYLEKYPDAIRYHSTLSITHNGVLTTNKNWLLRHYAGADGLKTGWIRASGHNLIFTAKRGDTRLLGVIMGAASGPELKEEAVSLLDAGFQWAASHDKTPSMAKSPARGG